MSEILIEWLPQEKVMHKSPEQAMLLEAVMPSGFREALDKIGEINAEIGLSRVSGIEGMYHDNLRLFHKKIIPECEHLSVCIQGKDIDNFSISIHSMKSMLATIGAMKLSEAAFKLETASKNKDLSYCAERFPSFREKLLSLYTELSVIFPEEETAQEKEPGDPGYLREYLQKALAAVDDYDKDTGLEAVNRLLAYDFGEENNLMLEKVSAAFQKYDFDDAREALQQLSS
jgi:HPt (histidine-containing phosphotransfer) domain-containing protein